MITTVTLNVAVDRQPAADALMPDNAAKVTRYNGSAGGNGINVSRVANIIGEKALAIGFADGNTGNSIEKRLCRKGIEHDLVYVFPESRPGAHESGHSGGKITEDHRLMVRQEDFEQLSQKLLANMGKTDIVVLSGGAPEGCSSFVYNELIRLVKESGKKVILDANGDWLAEGIKAMPTMIKMNTDEVGELTGAPVNDRRALMEAARMLHNQGIDYVVVSLGRAGALVACDRGVFEGTPPEVEVINTEGCEDSMVAAFAVGFARGYTIEQSLQYALAVSSAAAMTDETDFLKISDLFQIMDSAVVRKL